MKLLLVTALLLPAVPTVALAIPTASAQAPDRAAPAYQTYVACSTNKSAPASHSCGKNQAKAAFFKSLDAHVRYKVCVKFPGPGNRLCASAQDAPKGVKRVNPITSTKVGKHKVKWYVDGQKVGAFTFRVRSN